MIESRLGRVWNAALLFCWWDEGRIRAAKALFTRSPSTVPIRTSEFVIADLRALRRLDGEDKLLWLPTEKPLWRLQRNEPGCVVGEHMQVRFGLDGEDIGFFFTERSEIERSRENHTERARLTRVGEDDRWKEEDENLPEGEIERRPLDLALEDDDDAIGREEEEEGEKEVFGRGFWQT
ncbi:hypothetical protein AAC387_Pa03g0463 [Persea americana]|eukprot:TRINITY_DN347_c5_g1_i1.p1 TRINITY_DN347_c5_g1~~TRINITY_DN347_c5_g1_i1.p1  ORF type:complete len:179 (+),score=23.61 TRINITY_DN347_c5_g1_i1:1179-1715(+)